MKFTRRLDLPGLDTRAALVAISRFLSEMQDTIELNDSQTQKKLRELEKRIKEREQ